MPNGLKDPLDDVRKREGDTSAYVGGGEKSQEDYDRQFREIVQNYGQTAQEPEREVEQEGENRVKEEAKDKAEEEIRKRIKEGLNPEKAGEEAAKQGVEGAAKGAGEAATPGAEASTAGAAGAPGAVAGVGAGTGAGAAGAAGGAGAAGTAGAAGAGTAATGAAGATAATSAAGTGAAAGAAGAAAAGGAAAGAETGAATAAAAAGAATSETGVGAVVGFGIAAVIVVGGYVAKHRKEAALIACLLIVGLLIAGTLLLNIFKPFAETLQTAQKYMGPVAQIVEKRVLPILGRFAVSASSAAVAENRQNVAQAKSGGQVLAATSDGTVDGKLKTLFDAMNKDNFEQHIKGDYGLEFKQAAGGGINITVHDNSIGVAHNAVDAQNILQNNFGDLPNLLQDEVNGWSWAQHIKIARPSKTYYDIPALSVPGAEDAGTPPELVDLVKYKLTTVLTPGLTNMTRGITCFTTGQQCNDKGLPANGAAVSDYQDNPDSSLSTATQAAYNDSLKAVSPDSNYQTPLLAAAANKKVQDQLNSKAVGILGWLDIAASLSKMADDPNAQDLPAILREKQAGALWTWTESAVNQALAGDTTSQAASILTGNFDNFGDSQAYYYVAYDDLASGQGMAEQQKVNSAMKEPLKYINNLISQNPIFQTAVKTAFSIWLKIHSAAGLLIAIAERLPFANFVNTALLKLLDVTGVKSLVEQSLGISSEMMLPVCDPSDESFNFGNCLATGAHAQANKAVQDQFGGTTITAAEENELQAADVQRQKASLAALPWTERIFSRTNPNSFINVAAMQSPVSKDATQNVASFMQAMFGAVWSAPTRVAFLASKPAHAAGADSSALDGQGHYGIPLSVLKSTNTIPAELTTANGSCPQLEKGQLDICKSYSATIDSLIARYTYNPDYTGN